MELIVDSAGILKGEKPSKVHVGILLTIVAYIESGGPKELSIFSQLLHELLERDAKFSVVKSAKAGLVLPKRKKKIRQTKIKLKIGWADLLVILL